MSTTTGTPISVDNSAGMQMPENPDKPISIPDSTVRGLLQKMPVITATAVAITPMIICSMTHARRSSFAV